MNFKSLILLTLGVWLISPESHAQKRNGFDISDALVPASEIRRTGVKRDGIPSIDAPKFVSADAAEFLGPDDRVLGVFRNGVAKAYPIRILDHHEVVNDKFTDEAITITYCPLCYTGMAFSAQAQDFGLKFGVSGLLYNNDVLLYDRRTGSLWSQIMSRAISGPLKGVTLPHIPASHTTWREWRRRHADTLVLSTDTGFRRNYRKSPYLEYARSRSVMYPLTATDERYPRKSLVLGITLGGSQRAYPFSELRAAGTDQLTDQIGSREVLVEWSAEDEFARALDADGNELPSVIAYWFAWYAFHPETEVYTAP